MIVQDVIRGRPGMVSDNQVRRLRNLMRDDERLSLNAAKDRDGREDGTQISQQRAAARAKCRRSTPGGHARDPFQEVWSEIWPFLELNPGLEAKTLFDHLQRLYQGKFSDGQLRSFQRGVRRWLCSVI